MKKKHLILSVMIAVLLSVSPMAFAVEFGPNSAKITNPYFGPVKVGSWSFEKGVGPNWSGRLTYSHVFGKDVVSGAKIGSEVFNDVKCLKMHITIIDNVGNVGEHHLMEFSMAQDTEGNVWILKVYNHQTDSAIILGATQQPNGEPWFKSMLMPTTPAVGLPAGIIIPETDDSDCEIVEVGISTLVTAFGTYQDCIKAHCNYAPNYEVGYYCWGAGLVRSSRVNTPDDVIDRKGQGTATTIKAVVIPLGD